MIGRIAEFLWLLAFIFFILSVFIFPITFAYWRANERKRAEDTEKALQSLGFDTSNSHIYDA